jgi:hypothetical protein
MKYYVKSYRPLSQAMRGEKGKDRKKKFEAIRRERDAIAERGRQRRATLAEARFRLHGGRAVS